MIADNHPDEEFAMNTTNVVLHPTDFSDRSAGAAEVARDLARDRGARLLLLHVVPIISVPHLKGPAAMEDPDLCAERLEAIRSRLEASDGGAGVAMETRVELGDPASVILQQARDAGCATIVMGTHGRSGLRKMLLGSVAEEVLRHATCPVLAVRDGSSVPEPSGGG
jgi:nucleotide-binding universal stress UspA family protein